MTGLLHAYVLWCFWLAWTLLLACLVGACMAGWR